MESEPSRNRKYEASHRLIEASGEFLNRSPKILGSFPREEPLADSKRPKHGRFENYTEEYQRNMIDLGRSTWDELIGEEDRHLFFERMESNAI